MTYRELKEGLENTPEDQLDANASVYDKFGNWAGSLFVSTLNSKSRVDPKGWTVLCLEKKHFRKDAL